MTDKKPVTIVVARPSSGEDLDALVAAVKYSRRQSIMWAVFVAMDFLLACLNAWNVAYQLSKGNYFWAIFASAAVLFSVYAARQAFQVLKRAFRLWQVGCLLLETASPPENPPAPPSA